MNITLVSIENKKIELPIIKAFSTHNGIITFYDHMGFPHKYEVETIKQVIFN